MKGLLTVTAAAFLFACSHKEPPGSSAPVTATPLPSAPPVASTAPPAASVAVNVADAGAASADAGVPLATADAGVDPATLPQTRDKPTTYDDRGRALFEGVLSNEASMPAFFPVEAYKQVKAVGNPAGDFKARLVANYKRDVEALHKAIPSRAKYVRVDIPDGARWVEPNEEYNKIGYWRVFGAKVVYSVDDKEKSFPISSLISWRGEWFTVHLTGFK